MVPLLITGIAIHRIIMYQSLDKKDTEFDFTDTIQKLRSNEDFANVEPIQDR